MSKHLQSLLGFKPRSPSQDPDRPGSAKAETPRTTKKIQETLDWQTLNNHFDRYAKNSGPAPGVKESCPDRVESGAFGKTTKKIQETLDWQTLNKHLDQFEKTTSAVHDMKECGMDMMESANSANIESTMYSSSTQELEKELLVRKFLEAHAEVGRQALEVREVAHQLGDNDNDCKRELQIYELLMKDSTELFSALSQKLSRLRTKIESSSSVHSGKGRSSPTTEPTDHHRDSSCTQHRSWVQPKAPEQAPSQGSFHRRATSARHGGRNSIPDESKLHRSGTASQPVQRRPMSQTRYVHEPQSKVSAAGRESSKLKARSEVQSRTFNDLPIMAPEDLLRLDQPSTLPDLPVLDMQA